MRYKQEKLLQPLDERFRRGIQQITKILENAGFECFVVGGAVRDLILGRRVGDVDLTTNAHPEVVQKLFKRTIPTGIQHGTITVLQEGIPFEVTTYRAESIYSDARRPDSIEYADTLEEDLKRRDLTINALAYSPLEKSVIDLHGGVDDLNRKLIRTIGDPMERFHEDGLRTVRACRFAAVLDFTIEENTYLALSNREIHRRVSVVAIERFTDEIWKGAEKGKSISRMIRPLMECGLLPLFLPPDQFPMTLPDDSTLQLLDSHPEAPAALKMALWFESSGITDRQRMERLGKQCRFSGQMLKDLTAYRELNHFLAEKIQESSREQSLFRIRKFLVSLREASIHPESLLLPAAPLFQELYPDHLSIQDLINEIQHSPLIKELLINGNDLMEMGFKGREIGATLNQIRDFVLRSPSADRETLLSEARSRFNS